jgi:hypothetical protein
LAVIISRFRIFLPFSYMYALLPPSSAFHPLRFRGQSAKRPAQVDRDRAKRFSCLVVVRETDPNSPPVLYNGKCPVDIDYYTAPKKYVQHILRCNPWVLSTGYTCFYLFICLPFFLIFHQLL